MRQQSWHPLGQCNLYKLNGSALPAPFTISSTRRFHYMMDLIHIHHIHPTTIQPPFRSPETIPARTAYWTAWAALGPGERRAQLNGPLPTAQALAQRKVLLLLNPQVPPRQKERWVGDGTLLWGRKKMPLIRYTLILKASHGQSASETGNGTCGHIFRFVEQVMFTSYASKVS